MQDSGILATIVGALPEVDLRPRPPPRPRPKARKPPCKRKAWTRKKIADYVGVSMDKLVKLMRRCPKACELLNAPNGKFDKYKDQGCSNRDVRMAAGHIIRLMTNDAMWCPYLRLRYCKRCKKSDNAHHGKGVCMRCFSTERRRARGLKLRHPFPDCWDKNSGRVGCLICSRSSVRYGGAGMCVPCNTWWHNFGKKMPPEVMVFEVAKKCARLLAKEATTGVSRAAEDQQIAVAGSPCAPCPSSSTA